MKKTLIILIYFIFFWIVIPAGVFLSSIFFDELLHLEPFQNLQIAGGIVAFFGAILLLKAVLEYKAMSKELPVSAFPPSEIIRSGLYSTWRHPIYLFYSITMLGSGLTVQSKSFLLIVFPSFIVLLSMYIYFEESILKKRFGGAYIQYRKRTALIIPRFIVLLKCPVRIFLRVKFHFKVEGIDRLPRKLPFIIVSAHRNYLDPFYIGAAVDFPVSFVATFEVFRNKALKFLMDKFFAIPFKRFKPDFKAAKNVITLLDSGVVIGIFPEGERSWTGETIPLKKETLKLFRKLNHIPIVPVSIEGNFHAWPRWSKKMRKANVRLIFKEPILLNGEAKPEEIESLIRQAVVPDDNGIVCKAKELADNLSLVIYRCPICSILDTIIVAGNDQLICTSCQGSLKINSDYTLEYRQNDQSIHTTLPELYKQIMIGPEDIKNLSEQAVSSAESVKVYLETNTKLVSRGYSRICLTNEHILVQPNNDKILIQLKNISSVTIESNFKLQVFDQKEDLLYQFSFFEESALKWQHLLVKSLIYYHHFEPNTR